MSCIAFLFKMHHNRMKTSLESIRNSIKTGTKKETVIRLFLWDPAAAYPPMPSPAQYCRCMRA